MPRCQICYAERVTCFSSCLGCGTTVEPLELPAGPGPSSSPALRSTTQSQRGATRSPYRSPFLGEQPTQQTVTETALRKDLDVANRAVADLWLTLHDGSGLKDRADGMSLLLDELTLRMAAAAEMRADLVGQLSTALRDTVRYSLTANQLHTSREDAIAASVGQSAAVQQAEARAAAAEASSLSLTRQLGEARDVRKLLETELREIRSAKALQEVVFATEHERLRFEIEALRGETETLRRRLKGSGA
jgi:hypothetical protein